MANTIESSDGDLSECRRCGACCAYFRIFLNWSEVDELYFGGVPTEMTEKITDYVRVMKGTESSPVRCVALVGEVGKEVFCDIYEKRCTACRDFNLESPEGGPNEACIEARHAFGLAPAKVERR